MERKTSLQDFLEVVYQYYPRAPAGPDHTFEGFEQTEEHRRLVAARIRAGTDNGQWRTLLDRLRARFPECEVNNWSFHLASGSWDAAYTAKLVLPTVASDDGEHALVILVSFLVPYYVIYSLRWFYLYWVEPPPDEDEELFEGTGSRPTAGSEIRFEFTEEEAPYAQGTADEIEAVFGHAPFPLKLMEAIVPEAWTTPLECGTATLLECLFSRHRW